MRGKHRGFTLIELMMVIAIIAILAAIAYPSYQDSVRKTRRGQAKANLVEIADRMEKCHTVNNSYNNCFGGTNTLPSPLNRSPQTGSGIFYDVSLGTVAQNTFTLTATPRDDQATDVCGNLTLNHQGARGASQTDCW